MPGVRRTPARPQPHRPLYSSALGSGHPDVRAPCLHFNSKEVFFILCAAPASSLSPGLRAGVAGAGGQAWGVPSPSRCMCLLQPLGLGPRPPAERMALVPAWASMGPVAVGPRGSWALWLLAPVAPGPHGSQPPWLLGSVAPGPPWLLGPVALRSCGWPALPQKGLGGSSPSSPAALAPAVLSRWLETVWPSQETLVFLPSLEDTPPEVQQPGAPEEWALAKNCP